MAKQIRRERVAEPVHQELSQIIQRHIRDPRLGWTTITRVAMSPDLCYAKILVSVFGEPAAQEISLHILERAAPFLRGELGRRIRLRQTPELQFHLDHSLEHSQRINALINELEIPPEEAEEPEETEN